MSNCYQLVFNFTEKSQKEADRSCRAERLEETRAETHHSNVLSGSSGEAAGAEGEG